MSSRSAACTVARLVRSPLAPVALRIRSSSISMLVRTDPLCARIGGFVCVRQDDELRGLDFELCALVEPKTETPADLPYRPRSAGARWKSSAGAKLRTITRDAGMIQY